MFKKLLFLTANCILIKSIKSNSLRELKRVRTCPATCPPCTECDTKRGTCSLPLTGSCQINNINGVCTSGVCNTQIVVPDQPLKKCEKYQCPSTGTCTIVPLIDGSDCTYPGNGIHSYCLPDGCKPVLEGLSITLPSYNFGCLGFPDGINCDTNHNILDGETCQDGICKFKDGNYNGILP